MAETGVRGHSLLEQEIRSAKHCMSECDHDKKNNLLRLSAFGLPVVMILAPIVIGHSTETLCAILAVGCLHWTDAQIGMFKVAD